MLDMLEIEEKPLPNPLLKEREKSFPLGEDLGEAVGVRGGLSFCKGTKKMSECKRKPPK